MERGRIVNTNDFFLRNLTVKGRKEARRHRVDTGLHEGLGFVVWFVFKIGETRMLEADVKELMKEIDSRYKRVQNKTAKTKTPAGS